MRIFWTAFAITMFSLWLLDWPERDDSDPPVGGRSGLRVYHDKLTGCEYLGAAFGGITPRLDAKGKQICRDHQ